MELAEFSDNNRQEAANAIGALVSGFIIDFGLQKIELVSENYADK